MNTMFSPDRQQRQMEGEVQADPEFIAFYGTLMNNTDEGLEFVREDHIRGRMFDVGAFPAVIPSNDGSRVFVEVYKILDPGILRSFDAYEGYHEADPEASLYVRKTMPLVGHDDWVWTYIWNRSTADLQPLDHGDWRKVAPMYDRTATI